MNRRIVPALSKARWEAQEALTAARAAMYKAVSGSQKPSPQALNTWIYLEAFVTLWDGAVDVVVGSEDPVARLEQYQREVHLGAIEGDAGPMGPALFLIEGNAYDDWYTTVTAMIEENR